MGHHKRVPAPKESAAWTAHAVRYRSPATEDPPNGTLWHTRQQSVIVWAVVLVRVYFGSVMTRALRAEAQRALERLRLPPAA